MTSENFVFSAEIDDRAERVYQRLNGADVCDKMSSFSVILN